MAACHMAEHLASLEAAKHTFQATPTTKPKTNITFTTIHIIKVVFCQQMCKCLYLTSCRQMETMDDISRSSMIVTDLPVAPRTNGITTPT